MNRLYSSLPTLLFSLMLKHPHDSLSPDIWPLPNADVEWLDLSEKLQKEGVASVFFYYVKKNQLEHLLPPDIRVSLSDRFITDLKRNMSALAIGRNIFHRLKKSDIPVVVLKGLFLIDLIYPHPAMRGLADIDILVHKTDIFRTDACLRQAGYKAVDSVPERALHNPAGYLASLDYIHETHPDLHIHVHWHLVNTSVPATMFATCINMDDIWNKVIPAKIADTEVAILCPEHAIIYLCEHALRVGHSFDRLILVSDIFLLCKAYQNRIDWVRLWQESADMNLQKLLFLSLTIVETYTDRIIPENLREKWTQSFAPQLGERIFMSFYLRKRRFRGSSYLVYLSMNPTLFAKGRFLFRTLFPPAAILRQRRNTREPVSALENLTFYRQRLSEIFHHMWSIKQLFSDNKH